MIIYPENKEARYCKETYVDDYNTLAQSILIDLVMDQQSYGNHARTLRSSVNPNLHLSKIEYLDINMEVIKNGRNKNNFR